MNEKIFPAEKKKRSGRRKRAYLSIFDGRIEFLGLDLKDIEGKEMNIKSLVAVYPFGIRAYKKKIRPEMCEILYYQKDVLRESENFVYLFRFRVKGRV